MACNESQPSKSVEVEQVVDEPQWRPIVGIDPGYIAERDYMLTAVYETNGIATRVRIVDAADPTGTLSVVVNA